VPFQLGTRRVADQRGDYNPPSLYNYICQYEKEGEKRKREKGKYGGEKCIYIRVILLIRWR
jgi:hypothetical protein